MKDITDADYEQAKGVCKDSEIKIVGEYHDLLFKVMHDCQLKYLKYLEICLKIYELDAAKFLSVPGLAWPAG